MYFKFTLSEFSLSLLLFTPGRSFAANANPDYYIPNSPTSIPHNYRQSLNDPLDPCKLILSLYRVCLDHKCTIQGLNVKPLVLGSVVVANEAPAPRTSCDLRKYIQFSLLTLPHDIFYI